MIMPDRTCGSDMVFPYCANIPVLHIYNCGLSLPKSSCLNFILSDGSEIPSISGVMHRRSQRTVS